jgi:hypothetical protein
MADKRISGLPSLSSAAREDLLLVVDDPAGTPSNKKVTLTQFFSNVEPEIVFANTKTLSGSTNASVIFKGGVAVNDSVTIDADLTVNVNAVMNVVSMTAIHSNVQPGTNATHDLGNTSFGWKNAYVGIISGDTESNLLLAANTNASANIIFTGANVHIKSNTIIAGENTSITSNATFTGANVVVSGTNTHITSNVTLAGTNTDIATIVTLSGANVNITGTNAYITSNVTFNSTNTAFLNNVRFTGMHTRLHGDNVSTTSNVTIGGTDTSIQANVTLSGANTFINGSNTSIEANTTLKGTNTVITSNVTMHSNVALASVVDSTSNTTGALTVAGGVGILKSVTIGENLMVHGDVHADGNITAEGGTLTFGDADTDTVVFEADVGSDLIPNVDSTYDLGNTTHRFANAYIDDIVLTGNVVIGGVVTATGNVSGAFGIFTDNVSIGTDKSLTFRDATLEINSPADGELELASDDLITMTATANVEIDSAVFNVVSNSTFAGTNTVINSNVTISGANTVIASANVNLTGAGATIDGTLMNVKSNVVMTGITTLGIDGSGKNFTVWANTTGQKIHLKADSDQFISNTQIESYKKIRSDADVFVSNDCSLVFGSQFKIMDTASTTGFLLQEDSTGAGSGTEGGRVDLQEQHTLTHNSTAGFIFNDDLRTNKSLALFGASITSASVGDAAGVLAVKNGTAPTVQGADQAYLYAKDDASESHIYTMDEGGNETKLGPHNEDGEWEFYSRNVKTGKVMRINMERMIKKLEEFTGENFIEEN